MKRTKATANKFSKTATLLGENIKFFFAKDDRILLGHLFATSCCKNRTTH